MNDAFAGATKNSIFSQAFGGNANVQTCSLTICTDGEQLNAGLRGGVNNSPVMTDPAYGSFAPS